MRILLACGAGLSTSILMKKMEKCCEDKGEDLKIEAVPVGNVEGYQDEYDCRFIVTHRFRQQFMVPYSRDLNRRIRTDS